MVAKRSKNSWMDSDKVRAFNDDDAESENEVSGDEAAVEVAPTTRKGVSGPTDTYGVDKKILKKFMKSLASNKKRTVQEPLPCGLILQCRIQRSGGKYFLSLDMPSIDTLEDSKKSPGSSRVLVNDFLLASKKRKRIEPPSYIFSTDRRDLSRKSKGYVGKVNSDLRGVRYQIFDDGERPSGSTFEPVTESTRCELGIMNYKSNIVGVRGPRKLKMYLPPLDSKGGVTKWRPNTTGESCGIKGSACGQGCPFKLVNKKPVWSETAQAYQLNYYGRASVASVKNFQLVHVDDGKQVFLQLGKISNDTFILDFQYPFSPLLAFGTAIGSLAQKRLMD